MSDRYRTRDSLTGFNRTRLRGTLRVAMGVKSNADMFASKGDTWETTPSEQRRNTLERNKLERHLREANLTTDAKFIGYLRQRLSDPPIPLPVAVDKQRLATERKKERPAMSCRSSSRNKVMAAIAKANRLATLDAQLRANEPVKAKYSGKYKNYRHFTEVIEPLKQSEIDGIMAKAQERAIALLTYVFCVRSMVLSHVGQFKQESVNA